MVPASSSLGGREPDDLDAMLAEVDADPAAQAAFEDAMWRRAFFTRLAAVRGDRKQREVASLMGTTQSAVSDLEQGRVDPRLSTVQRYTRAVGAHVDVALVAHGREPFELTEPRLVPLADELAEGWGLRSVLRAFAGEHEDLARSPGSVAGVTGLPEPTVSYTMGRLEASGWLVQEDQAEGEPTFSLRERRGLFVGATVRRDSVQAALTDLRATAVYSQEYKLRDKSPAGVVKVILRAVNELQQEMRESGDLVGLGVTLAGRVDGDSGRVVSAPALDEGEGQRWIEVPLEDMLEAAMPCHVAVEDEAKALAVHTYLVAGERQDAYVVLITEDGISAGHVVSGRAANGYRGLAGQLGHMSVDPDGEPCACGSSGCLATTAGVPALVAAVSSACGGNVGSLEQAAYLVQEGNEAAERTFREAGASLGKILAGVVPALGVLDVVIYGPAEVTGEDEAASAAAYIMGLRQAMARVAVWDTNVKVSARRADPTLVCEAAATAAQLHFLDKPLRWLPSLGRTTTRPDLQTIDLTGRVYRDLSAS